MKQTTFDCPSEMEQAAFELLVEYLQGPCDGPHAIMLSGGQTPLGLYQRIERSPVPADPHLWLLITDERHVPLDSPESNFGKMRGMVAWLRIESSRVMRVDTALALDRAADRYDRDLAAFLQRGGRITLGLLGLGADGHVASLFDAADLARGKGRYAIAVPRPAGPDRVSVTPGLLARVQRLVFLVAGAAKTGIVNKMATDPDGVVAAQAIKEAPNVEVWLAGHVAG